MGHSSFLSPKPSLYFRIFAKKNVMAMTLSRKVVIYIDGKPAEAFFQKLRQQLRKLSNEQQKFPT